MRFQAVMDLARATTVTCAVLSAALAPSPAGAGGYEWVNAGVQARIGERRVIGKKSPDSFQEYDVTASWLTPLQGRLDSSLSLGARVFASAGAFIGPDKTAAVATVIPLLAFGTQDHRFTLDAGVGFAFLSEHRYQDQDFGGPVQFALTAGFDVPLYAHAGIGYRFMHYSDWGFYGSDTIGVDLHMATLIWRFGSAGPPLGDR